MSEFSYTYKTDDPHFNNSETMQDYIDNEMDQSWEVIMIDGTYAEIMTDAGAVYEVHASGNGDSYNHKIDFKLID